MKLHVLLGVVAAAVVLAPAASPALAPYVELKLDGTAVRFAQASFSGTTVVLRGGAGSAALQQWALSAKRSDPEVVMYDVEGVGFARYTLESAWPKIEVEGVTIQAERIERVG